MSRTLRDLAVTLAAFTAATGIAALLGAANFGTALTAGQVGFVLAMTWVLVRR